MIYTFYSYKGGVGRSMALANVAELLVRRKLRVLVIDFDLEAPGLERFFDGEEGFSAETATAARGIIDLFYSYRELRSLTASLSAPGSRSRTAEKATLEERISSLPVESLERFVVPVYTNHPSGGSLSIIPAGKRLGGNFRDYAQKVLSFEWDDFYRRFDGELFFEWFRRQAIAPSIADVVLIDSRTGITEMSGVCTYHLADAVISFVGTNEQNMQGALQMGRSLADRDLVEKGRQKRELWQIFVPSRIENTESDKLNQFASEFNKTFADFFPSRFKWERSPFFDLMVPYVPAYVFGERVAARDPSNQPLAEVLVSRLTRLTDLMTQLAPSGSALHKSLTSSAVSAAAAAEEAFLRLPASVQNDALAILAMLVRIGDVSRGVPDSLMRVERSRLPPSSDRLIADLIAANLVIVSRDDGTNQESIALASEHFLSDWTRLMAYIDREREFLLWRERFVESRAVWLETRQPTDLLSGKHLLDASRWTVRRPDAFSPEEHEFVRRSEVQEAQIENLAHWTDMLPLRVLLAVVLVAMAFAPIWGYLRLPKPRFENYLRAIGVSPKRLENTANFAFALDPEGRWSNRDLWIAPSTWNVVPEGGLYEAAVVVSGEGIGVPKGTWGYFDYLVVFRVRVKDNGTKAAWAVRVQHDRQTAYVFVLEELPEGVAVNGLFLQNGLYTPLRRDLSAPGDLVACGPHAQYSVALEVRGSRFRHLISCPNSSGGRFEFSDQNPLGPSFGSAGFLALGSGSSAVYSFLSIRPNSTLPTLPE